ncbi:MAG: GtrA family protein [Ruminococcus sp.]|nr:GtrA family protein [Ruminococcus sp.]
MAQGFIERTVDRTLGKKLQPEKQTALVQFIKFGIIGVSNTVISYVLNAATLLILKPYEVSWDYIAGNIISFVLSVLWSFYWNNKYVFTAGEDEQRSTLQALMKTYVSYGFTGIVLNNILSYLWIEKLGISKYIAPLFNLVLSVPLNFIINKFWAFRTKKK